MESDRNQNSVSSMRAENCLHTIQLVYAEPREWFEWEGRERKRDRETGCEMCRYMTE